MILLQYAALLFLSLCLFFFPIIPAGLSLPASIHLLPCLSFSSPFKTCIPMFPLSPFSLLPYPLSLFSPYLRPFVSVSLLPFLYSFHIQFPSHQSLFVHPFPETFCSVCLPSFLSYLLSQPLPSPLSSVIPHSLPFLHHPFIFTVFTLYFSLFSTLYLPLSLPSSPLPPHPSLLTYLL